VSAVAFAADLPPNSPKRRKSPAPWTGLRHAVLGSPKRRGGGFAHLALQAAVLASPSGSTRTARCSTVQRDCRADARALAGSESPQTLLVATFWFLSEDRTERGGFEPPVPASRCSSSKRSPSISHQSPREHPGAGHRQSQSRKGSPILASIEKNRGYDEKDGETN